MVALEDFKSDAAWADDGFSLSILTIPDQIAGVELRRLIARGDARGDLTVLLSTQYENVDPLPPQVYLVNAQPGSVRAWVYHKHQSDRLAFTDGQFRIVLYDLRPESPTFKQLNVIEAGATNRLRLTIPAFVVHGVQNRGTRPASFLNMPSRAYDPSHPDKLRLPFDHPDIPYRFE